MSDQSLSDIRKLIRANIIADEAVIVPELARLAGLSADDREMISNRAAMIVKKVRGSSDPALMESFLAEYGLSTKEGVALMCLAEALLRVPDAETVDDLIRDKIAPHNWSAHSGQSSSIFVNASTWALALTGQVLDEGEEGIDRTLRSLVRRLGEPVIRTAVGRAMREMGDQFVLGETIKNALANGKEWQDKGYHYSFDMLGEAARTEKDAQRYFAAYKAAIGALAGKSKSKDIRDNPGISVKLSALHPRYEYLKREGCVPVLSERLRELALAAKDASMGLNVDAEEMDRLDLSLDIIEQVLSSEQLKGWDGFGVVVQAYGPRARFVVDWLYRLACDLDRRIMVRLVKGAYWDTEVKRAQVFGLEGYPVFTRKVNTDVSYLACARRLLSLTDRIYPQFATHNAHTAAAVLAMAKNKDCFEFQRLHGMGEALHDIVKKGEGTRCRIYAPVGAHEDLLAYLVRRLLENGANSSFVNQIVDEDVTPEDIARDPISVIEGLSSVPNPGIVDPKDLFKPARSNSKGWDFTDPVDVSCIEAERSKFADPYTWNSKPLTPARGKGEKIDMFNPGRPHERVGSVLEATAEQVRDATKIASKAQGKWEGMGAANRGAILAKVADLYEQHAEELFALAAREAGKTLMDCIAEVREAVDFLRYYGSDAWKFENGTAARGVIACISPWNFPLAIFTGQISAALAAGNAVVAKPAEQTPLIAARAIEFFHEAGVPAEVLHLLPGDGPTVGQALVSSPDIAGVCFTGSTEVAKLIDQQLAQTAVPDAMLIAETGGMNAMIVDSTALPEQAVRDILASAFQSAGQRCSALRILYVQEDVSHKVIEMLTGAMQALEVGDPWKHSTDVGPVIDEGARANIADYCKKMEADGRLIAKIEAPKDGRFVAPHILKVSGIGEMEREIFGPVLHVATFDAEDIDTVIADINDSGYGLTFGLHTRIEARVQHIVDHVHAGNIYVNRNQIGAIVGSQPFGGEGLSGTGPKAGGPNYLRRFRKSANLVDAANETGAVAILKDASFRDRSKWLGEADRIGKLRKALRGKGAGAIAAAASVDPGPIDLPGPTGEANTLQMVALGNVVCLGSNESDLLTMTLQALAAGNSVVAVGRGAAAALSSLTGKEFPVLAFDGEVDCAAIAALGPTAVGASLPFDQTRELRRVLANKPGPIVRLITEIMYPEAWYCERAVCVDTTAAGGNASLLASAA